MTYAEVKRITEAVRLRGVLTGSKLRIQRGPMSVEFGIEASVPDAHSKSAAMTTIYFVSNIDSDALTRFSTRDLLRYLRGMIKMFLQHEADEAFTVRGLHPFNPHAAARQ